MIVCSPCFLSSNDSRLSSFEADELLHVEERKPAMSLIPSKELGSDKNLRDIEKTAVFQTERRKIRDGNGGDESDASSIMKTRRIS